MDDESTAEGTEARDFGPIPCMECGRPWGFILERGEEPTEAVTVAAYDAMVTELVADDYDDTSWLPDPEVVRVAFVTDALARFAYNEKGAESVDPGWYDLRSLYDLGFEPFMFKGRRQRWAIWWDCCGIRYPAEATT